MVATSVMALKPDAQFFKELTLQWMNAWKDRDRASLEHLLADNFNYISRNRKDLCMNKAEWLQMALEIYRLDKFEVDFISITVHEHACVVLYRTRQYARPNYTGEPEEFFVTDVWGNEGDRWKAITRQPMPV